MPDVDYIPLFALLGSQLTEAEVAAIAEELASESDPDSAEAIRTAIKSVTHEQPKRLRHRQGQGPARGRRLAAGEARPPQLARAGRQLTGQGMARGLKPSSGYCRKFTFTW